MLEREAVFELGSRWPQVRQSLVARTQFNAKASDGKAMRRNPLSHGCGC